MSRKILFSFIAAISMCYTGKAQYNIAMLENLKLVAGKYPIASPEKVEGIILYQQRYMQDALHPDSTKTDTMALSFSQNFSDFRLEDMREIDSVFSKEIDRVEGENKNKPEPFPTYKPNISKERFLTDNNTVYEYKNLFDKHYLLKYNKDRKTDWKIEDSTKNIHGFICQKATANVLGRNYIAWFSTDIPGSFGPRTLHGLPGVILQAYDTTGTIYYTAIKILAPHTDTPPIGIPAQGIECTPQEFNAMMEAVKRDPQSFLTGQKDIGFVQGRGKQEKTNILNNKKKKKEQNNPIELVIE